MIWGLFFSLLKILMKGDYIENTRQEKGLGLGGRVGIHFNVASNRLQRGYRSTPPGYAHTSACCGPARSG
jgi:hypothetical protein